MADSSPLPNEPPTTVLDDLREVVPLLREVRHIEPEARQALADLVDELIRVIDPNAPVARTAHLAESSTHLIQVLHRKQHAGLINTAKERLEEAAARAEAEAPVATGLARRLIDALANLGI